MNGVSTVIAIYRPTAEQLNKCLDCILYQVDDIAVVVDRNGKLPMTAMAHPKIRYLWMPADDAGYGRKANHGVNFTKGEFIWLLNDDVFAAPDCCARLMDVMNESGNIGMVGHELRYEDGKIQHGGTFRMRDGPCYGHLDLGQRQSRVEQPTEMEAVTGASVLIRRKAFVAARGFSEEYYLYCEDFHLCLAMRQAGWRVYYTPHAKATHLTGVSAKATPGLGEHIDRSWKTFQKHWAGYFEKNRGNAGLGVFK